MRLRRLLAPAWVGVWLLAPLALAQSPGSNTQGRARETAPVARQKPQVKPVPTATPQQPLPVEAASKPSGGQRGGRDPSTFEQLAPDPAELVEVLAHIPDALVELRYATRDNFVGEVMYPADSRCLLRRDALLRLVKVADALRAEQLRLKLWDCYRPLAVQWKLWERFPKPGYVADPRRGGNHNRGAAIDLTLVDAAGDELEMPTPYDSFQKAAHQGYAGGTARSRQNRDRLRRAMEAAGFRINRSEWWHFDAPGALKLPVRDEPLVAGEAQP